MLNRIIIQGRIGNDIELKSTNSGKEVCSINLAVDRDFKSQNGARETDWITVIAFGEKAKFLSRFFGKGRMAVVEGRLQMREWTDKDGKKRKNAEVVADSVYFGDSKKTTDERFNDLVDRVDQFNEIPDDDGELPF